MARRSKILPKNLTASHYYAMGQVSARWAQVEHYILKVIADVSGIHLGDIGMLIGHASLQHWLDVLAMYVEDSDKYKHRMTTYNKLIDCINMLYSLRNSVVHPLWISQDGKIAKGISLPKRGRKLLKHVSLTSSEMNGVARMTEAVLLLLRVHKMMLEPDKHADYQQRLDGVHRILCTRTGRKQQKSASPNLLREPKTPKTQH